jgi:broad specificity phosphatase PhoE
VTARLTLIAHAATEALRSTAFPLDEPVVEREIAKIAAHNWTAPRAEHVWAAPELRTQQTSHALGLQSVISDKLRDCDYGAWCGRKMDEVHSEDAEGILAWLTEPAASPHGGESIKDLIGRVGRWMEEQSGVGHTIAVTHQAVIRAALVYALRVPAQAFWRFDIAPLSLTDLRFSRNIWTLRCVGCPMQAHGQTEESDAGND